MILTSHFKSMHIATLQCSPPGKKQRRLSRDGVLKCAMKLQGQREKHE